MRQHMISDGQIDISFCIPVFNAADFIEDCLNAIFMIADDVSYEVICVDDCSTDNSLAVLEKIAFSNKAITVLKNEENKGVSYTRNECLKHACGRYIWFVDPDDMIVASTAKTLVDIADKNNVDFVWGNYVRISSDYRSFNDSSFEGNTDFFLCSNNRQEKNWTKTLPQDYSSGYPMRSACAGIYRTEFLKENGIEFTVGINMCEDIAFNYLVEVRFHLMAKFSGVVYKYRINPKSACHSFSEEKRVKTYLGALKMLNLYRGYLASGEFSQNEFGFVPKNTLIMRISRLQQNVITDLAAISNSKYVRKELNKLKKIQEYPYKLKKDILIESGKTMRNYLFYFSAFEPFFWILHLVYKIKYRNN